MSERQPPTGDVALPAWTLVQTAHRAARRFHTVFARHGLTAHQFGILVQLDRNPGSSQAALARAILVTPQSVGPLITQMQDAGLLRRQRPARRGVAASVALTDAGRRLLHETFPDVAAINTPEALGLDADEAATLEALLRRVLVRLDGPDFMPFEQGL